MFSLKVICGKNGTLTVATMILSWVGAVDTSNGIMTGFHLNGFRGLVTSGQVLLGRLTRSGALWEVFRALEPLSRGSIAVFLGYLN